jgi:pimeloyl-ACP methyl ester carboxylesterase
MNTITLPNGTTVSYDSYGSGPPLVLVHGSFSDHSSNWEFVAPMLREQFTIYAVARRGRGETDATEDHSLEDEAGDIAAVIEAVGEPVFLLGHSYGAHCALLAAALQPGKIRKLVVYEPAWPHILSAEAAAPLEKLAMAENWDDFAFTFFRDLLRVPIEELEALRASALWAPNVADAEASYGDMRAIMAYECDVERFAGIGCPVLLQTGSESPRELYATDALAAVLPDASIEVLPGQAHEGMTTAPEMYARMVTAFLLGGVRKLGA